MQIPDLVKLIYQSEFAGGHLINDARQSEARLTEERRAVSTAGAPSFSVDCDWARRAFEDIGGGLCRLHLAALDAMGISSATANAFFVSTARAVHGDISGFEQKLCALMDCCREGLLPFNAEAVVRYVAPLKAEGYPPVSHSAEYREAYRPAYRVVSARYREYIELFRRIDALLCRQASAVVAIDGRSAAGKTTLARWAGEVYGANVFHMDDYFLPPERKTEQRLAEPGGNVDYERFAAEVMAGIQSGAEFTWRAYDCHTGTLGLPAKAAPARLNIVEGAYSLHPSLADRYDIKVFLDVEANEQSRRILARNGEAMHARFIHEWIPLEESYIAAVGLPDSESLVFKSESRQQ
jgi:hypothetical protein